MVIQFSIHICHGLMTDHISSPLYHDHLPYPVVRSQKKGAMGTHKKWGAKELPFCVPTS